MFNWALTDISLCVLYTWANISMCVAHVGEHLANTQGLALCVTHVSEHFPVCVLHTLFVSRGYAVRQQLAGDARELSRARLK